MTEKRDGHTGSEVIYVPGNRKLIVFLRDKLEELLKPGWIEPKPVYAASALLLVAGLAMLGFIHELREADLRRSAVQYADAQAVENQQNRDRQFEVQPANETPKNSRAVGEMPVITDSKSINSPDGHKQEAQWPIKGSVILDFGWQFHPVYKDWRYHTGIDIDSSEGLFVVAMLPGKVTDIYSDHVTGLTAVIQSGQYVVYYGSLAAVNVSLQKGSYVETGDKIGTVGVCRAEPYTHLHLAVKEGDGYIDPRRILK